MADGAQYAASHLAAFTMSSVCGSTKSSSVGAYGSGTSWAVTRMIGPSSHSNACSLMRAVISPATPPVRVSSWTISTLLVRSEEHTSELQSQSNLVCRLLLEKKKTEQQLIY